MELGNECRSCLVKSQSAKVAKYEEKVKVKQFISQMTELAKGFDVHLASPLLMKAIDELHKEIFGYKLDYSKEKHYFNELCLKYEPSILDKITEAKDPLKEAIKYARVGNLIDLAKLSNISDNMLDYFVDLASSQSVDEFTYEKLVDDLNKATNVTYLLDNCGEIVFDKILIKVLLKKFPKIHLTAVTRGEAIVNDVTIEDADEVGLNKICDVIGNGTRIPGTWLPLVDKECQNLIKESDLTISKGLGNFETLHDCGLNIYYMFLCKCQYFANRFNLPLWSSVLINEQDIK